jgi:hypothetical protein
MAPPVPSVDAAEHVRRAFSSMFEAFDTAAAVEAAHLFLAPSYVGRHDGRALDLDAFVKVLSATLRRLSVPARITWKSMVPSPVDRGRVHVTSVHDVVLTFATSVVVQSVISLIEVDASTWRIVGCEELTRIQSETDTATTSLTLAELEQLREAAFADDVPIEPHMASWTPSAVMAYFEQPPMEASPPALLATAAEAKAPPGDLLLPPSRLHATLSLSGLPVELRSVPQPRSSLQLSQLPLRPESPPLCLEIAPSARSTGEIIHTDVVPSPPSEAPRVGRHEPLIAGVAFRRCRSSPASVEGVFEPRGAHGLLSLQMGG